jgi:hypothetical protein
MTDDSTTSREARHAEDPAQWSASRLLENDKAWRSSTMAFRPSAAFFDVAEPIVTSRRTLLGYDRLYAIWQAVHNVARVPGVAAEIGAYRGGSAYFIASTLRAVTGSEVPMHVFDTFQGHPENAITEHDTVQAAGQFSGTHLKKVTSYLSAFTEMRLHTGDVSESLADLPEYGAYRFVHIDTDLYKPTLDCLEYFGRRLSPGGVIVVDDYSSRKCPGVPKATTEYLHRTELQFHVWDVRTEQLVLTRWSA